MIFWLTISCVVLIVITVALGCKIVALHHAANEIRLGLQERLKQDTNTLLTISSNDCTMRRLAQSLNEQLVLLRHERRRYQQGDRELKEAITNISHDLRTPLTAIMGYLDLINREVTAEELTRYLTFIENRTTALQQLTEELFHYAIVASEPEKLLLEPVNLNRALEESIAASYDTLLEQSIVPTINIPHQTITLPLNDAALSRVFSNILSNALKYSDGDLAISLSESGEIIFTNTAAGLTEIEVAKLFHRFYTVEAARNATGLGLTISQILIEKMNGEITANYDDNKLTISIRWK
ncbi:sensor histidine kinase [Paenibacillus yanchengensis]|uniref:histidine kinase n=1 Tax=Paenibacillus yanchengensis TaxID=2035833 RepID=A0ABW4YES4_9BACL